MLDNEYIDRLTKWRNFRNTLEVSDDPIQDTIDFYKKVPLTCFHTDPYDPSTWPDPWQLISENLYCEYCILLGICYTLQLTDRLKSETFEIHIAVDEKKSETHYLLFVGDVVVGYHDDLYVNKDTLPSTLVSQSVFPMANTY